MWGRPPKPQRFIRWFCPCDTWKTNDEKETHGARARLARLAGWWPHAAWCKGSVRPGREATQTSLKQPPVVPGPRHDRPSGTWDRSQERWDRALCNGLRDLQGLRTLRDPEAASLPLLSGHEAEWPWESHRRARLDTHATRPPVPLRAATRPLRLRSELAHRASASASACSLSLQLQRRRCSMLFFLGGSDAWRRRRMRMVDLHREGMMFFGPFGVFPCNCSFQDAAPTPSGHPTNPERTPGCSPG